MSIYGDTHNYDVFKFFHKKGNDYKPQRENYSLLVAGVGGGGGGLGLTVFPLLKYNLRFEIVCNKIMYYLYCQNYHE